MTWVIVGCIDIMTSKDTHKMVVHTTMLQSVYCVPIDWDVKELSAYDGSLYRNSVFVPHNRVDESMIEDYLEEDDEDRYDQFFECETHQCENCGDMSEADLQLKNFNIWKGSRPTTMLVCEPCFAKTEIERPHRCSNYPCFAGHTCVWKGDRYCDDCKSLMIEAIEY